MALALGAPGVPGTLAEAEAYVQHRMITAGGSESIFQREAIEIIHQRSGGIPRLVNAVCDKALLASFVQRSDRINFSMVGRAIRELEGNIYA